MRRDFSKALLLLSTVLFFAGCTSSAHPLTGEPTRDLDLAGTWLRDTKIAGPGPPQITLEHSEKRRNEFYFATVGKRMFDLHVFRIGKAYYVNMLLVHDQDHSDGVPTLLLPLNLFARVELHKRELHVFPVNEGRALELYKKYDVPYIEAEQGFQVLTLSSKELKKLVVDHGDELFVKSPVKYVRKPITARACGQSR